MGLDHYAPLRAANGWRHVEGGGAEMDVEQEGQVDEQGISVWLVPGDGGCGALARPGGHVSLAWRVWCPCSATAAGLSAGGGAAMSIKMPDMGSSSACELRSLAHETASGFPLSVDDLPDLADHQVFQGALHIAVGDGATKHRLMQEATASRHQAETPPSGASSDGVDAFSQTAPASVDVDFSLHAQSLLEDESQGGAREQAVAEVAIQENYIQGCLFSGLMNVVGVTRNTVQGWEGGFSGVVAKVISNSAQCATSMVLEKMTPSLGKDTWDELATVVVSSTESIATSSYTAVQKWIDILNNIAVRKAIQEIFPQMTEAVANDISQVSIAMLSDSSPSRMKSIGQGLQVAMKSLMVCSLEEIGLDMTRFWMRAISGAFISTTLFFDSESNRLTIKFMSIGAKALTANALCMGFPGLGKYAAADLANVLFPIMEPTVVKLSNGLVDAAFELFFNSEGMELYFEEYGAHGE